MTPDASDRSGNSSLFINATSREEITHRLSGVMRDQFGNALTTTIDDVVHVGIPGQPYAVVLRDFCAGDQVFINVSTLVGSVGEDMPSLYEVLLRDHCALVLGRFCKADDMLIVDAELPGSAATANALATAVLAVAEAATWGRATLKAAGALTADDEL